MFYPYQNHCHLLKGFELKSFKNMPLFIDDLTFKEFLTSNG